MVYLLAIVAGSFDLLAAWFILREPPPRIEPRYIVAFAAGVILAVSFLDILPEVDLRATAPFLALGFVTFYVLEKMMMIHACGESECATHEIGPMAVLGMALDNVVDGAGIAVGYLMDPVLGLAIAVAVVLHEIPQGITSALIMRDANWTRAGTLLALGLAGLLYPVGALLAGQIPPHLQQKMLAFIAGSFIYIGAGDLLPEAHRRFNWKVILSLLGGMGLMLGLKALVPVV